MSTIHSDQFRSNSNQCGHHVYNMYILINSDQIPINVDIMSTIHSDQFRSNSDQCGHYVYSTFWSNFDQCAHHQRLSDSKTLKAIQIDSEPLKATQSDSRRLKATQSDSKQLKETLFHNLVVKDFKRILNLVYQVISNQQVEKAYFQSKKKCLGKILNQREGKPQN